MSAAALSSALSCLIPSLRRLVCSSSPRSSIPSHQHSLLSLFWNKTKDSCYRRTRFRCSVFLFLSIFIFPRHTSHFFLCFHIIDSACFISLFTPENFLRFTSRIFGGITFCYYTTRPFALHNVNEQ